MTNKTETPGRLIVSRESKPQMPPYLKLRHDAGRGRWVLLAPERILTPDQIAVEVLQLCVTSEAPAARALYERLGFQQWGHERSAMKVDGRRIDEFHYAMRVG